VKYIKRPSRMNNTGKAGETGTQAGTQSHDGAPGMGAGKSLGGLIQQFGADGGTDLDRGTLRIFLIGVQAQPGGEVLRDRVSDDGIVPAAGRSTGGEGDGQGRGYPAQRPDRLPVDIG
jgi:hypothetical protein